DIRGKADRLAEMLWHRLGVDFADRRAELIGYRSCWGSAAPDVEPNEGVFRAAVRDPDRGKVERFAHTLLGFALQGPPGLGVFGGRPEVQEAYAYWPALVPRELVRPRIEILRGETRVARELPSGPPGGACDATSRRSARAPSSATSSRACGRSTSFSATPSAVAARSRSAWITRGKRSDRGSSPSSSTFRKRCWRQPLPRERAERCSASN